MTEGQIDRAVFLSDQPGFVIRAGQRAPGPTLSRTQLLQLVGEVLPQLVQGHEAGPAHAAYPSPHGMVNITFQQSTHAVQVALVRVSAEAASSKATSSERPTPPPVPASFAPRLERTFRVEHRTLAVAFSPEGQQLASGSMDKQVRLWDVASGQVQQTLTHGGGLLGVAGVTSLCFAPDGRSLASGSSTNVNVWNVLTGKARWSQKGLNKFFSLACSPDGMTLASGDFNGVVSFWSLLTGTLKHGTGQKGFFKGMESVGEQPAQNLVAYSPDGKVLAAARNREVKLWDSQSGTLIGHIQDSVGGFLAVISSIAFSPDGLTLACGQASTGPSKVVLFEVPSGRQQALSTTGSGVCALAFSPDGMLLATGGMDGEVRLYEAALRELVRTLKDHEAAVRSLAFSSDGGMLSSGSDDKTVRLWRIH